MPDSVTLAQLLGPWQDSGFESNLITRCRNAWNKPLEHLTDMELTTCLDQNLAVQAVLAIARRRLAQGIKDGTELYDGNWQKRSLGFCKILSWLRSLRGHLHRLYLAVFDARERQHEFHPDAYASAVSQATVIVR